MNALQAQLGGQSQHGPAGGAFGGPASFGAGLGKGKDGKGDTGRFKIRSGEPCYIGQVKNFVVERQRGFIVCEEIFNMCGDDVYVHQSVLQAAMAGPGDTVAFFVHWSPTSGKPQASAPMVRLAAADGHALKGIFKPGPSHGFLKCDVTHEFFGRDVYVNQATAATFTEGACYAFNAYGNRDKMPNCDGKEGGFEMCDEFVFEPVPGDLSSTREDPTVVIKGKGQGKGMESKGKMGGMGKGMNGQGGGGGPEMQMFNMFKMMMGMGGDEGDWSGGGKGGGGDWGGGGKGGGDWSAGGKSGKGLVKMKICTPFLEGNCNRGDRCTYAHSEEEIGTPQPAPIPKGPPKGEGKKGGSFQLVKMKMCVPFENGTCNRAERCTYAHSEAEIGTPQPPQAPKGESKGFGDGKGKGDGKEKGFGKGPKPTGETFIGVIKTFNPATNYGFIACEESEETYGVSEIFFHGVLLEYCDCLVGDLIEFDVGLNKEAKPQAQCIRALNHPSAKRQRIG